MKHEYAQVNGTRLHYVTTGEGNLILFLHGFPEFWYAWKDQLAEFGRDHLAVAPDMRGYNLSSKPVDVEQYRMDHLVEDVRALVEHLGRKKLVLVGHDWGGVVAWFYAIQHPECVERLVIINAPHPGVFQRELSENPAQQQASQYMLFFRGSEAEKALSADNNTALVDGVLGEGLKQGTFTEEDRAAYLEAWSQPGALTGGLNYYRAARVGPPSGEGEEPAPLAPEGASLVVKAPTLVIWGERDPFLLTGNLEAHGSRKWKGRIEAQARQSDVPGRPRPIEGCAGRHPVRFPGEIFPHLVCYLPMHTRCGAKHCPSVYANRGLEGLEQFVPDLQILRIPDGSHWVVHEQPAVVNAAIRGFLAIMRRGN